MERKSEEFHPRSSKHVRQQPACLITLEPQPAAETLHSSLSAPPTVSCQHGASTSDLLEADGLHAVTHGELLLQKKRLR